MIGIYYLYFHKNPKTNQIFYVGIGVRYRYKEIKTNRNQHYLNYVNKHGYPLIEIIHKNVSFQKACKLEIKYIKQFGRIGYEKYGILVNKGLGGEVGARGMKHSKEWKDNHSKQMTIISNTEEFKDRISKLHSGKTVSKETRNKISKSLELIKEERSNNIKIGLSKIDRGPAISEGRKKPVLKLDKNNKVLQEYPSVKDAILLTNIKGINNVVTGRCKTAGGYNWKYL